MQGSIRQLITDLHATNEKLKRHLQEEKQKRVYISTTLSDARYTIRQQRAKIEKLERRHARIKARRRFKISKLWRRK